MPSPVGHSLAGLCVVIATRNRLPVSKQGWLLVGSIVVANLPDIDFLPGLVVGNLSSFHHQATHSLIAVAMFGFLVSLLAMRNNLRGIFWGIWAGSLYFSHLMLDLLVNDPAVPYGLQLLWPFSTSYFISTVTPFQSFQYSASYLVQTDHIFSIHNLTTIAYEVVLIAPFVGLTWFVERHLVGRHRAG